MLPKTITDDEVTAVFSNYGTIKELQILRGSQQTSKGVNNFLGCNLIDYTHPINYRVRE